MGKTQRVFGNKGSRKEYKRVLRKEKRTSVAEFCKHKDIDSIGNNYGYNRSADYDLHDSYPTKHYANSIRDRVYGPEDYHGNDFFHVKHPKTLSRQRMAQKSGIKPRPC